MNYCHLTLPLSLLAAGLVFAATVQAQTANSAPAPSNSGDQVVTLSEFDVTANSGGYMPTESATGSRIAVQVKDIPYAISSVTSEYLKDFGIFSLTDELAFSSSMSGLNDVGGFNLRGFGGNISLRNGFSRLGFFDPAVYDRIEFIKGPAAAIYGQTNPGGIVNFVTKKPKSTPHQDFSQTLGSYKSQRSQLGLSGPIVTGTGTPKLFYAVETAYAHRHYESPTLASTTREAYLDLIYKFTPQTSLEFDFDYNYMSFTGGTSGVGLPEVFDTTQPATSTHQYTGLACGIIHDYYADSSQWNHRTTFQYETVFESQLTDILSLRVAGGIYRDPRFTYSDGLSSQFDPRTGNLLNNTGRTNFSFLQGDGHMGSVDLVAHYNIPGQGDQKTLFTTDYYDNIGKRPSWSTATGTLPTTYNVFHPRNDPFIPFTTPLYTIQSNSGGLMEDDYAAATGVSLRQYGNFFNSKLIAAVGVRMDRVKEFKEFLVGTPGKMTTQFDFNTPRNYSKEIGLAYVIRPDLNFYVNRTESFVRNSPSTLSPTGGHLPNQTGVGYEAGFKGALLDSKLNFTADVFDIELKNVAITALDNNGNSVNVASGKQYGKGVEFDGSWQAMPNLWFLLSASYNDAYYGNQGSDLDLKGRKISGVPEEQAVTAVAWEVVKGVKLTAKTRSYSKFRVDNNAGTAKIGGLQINNDGRREITGPSYTILDLGVNYTWKASHGLSQTLQLEAKNVLNKTYVIVGSRVVGDKLGFYVTYSLTH